MNEQLGKLRGYLLEEQTPEIIEEATQALFAIGYSDLQTGLDYVHLHKEAFPQEIQAAYDEILLSTEKAYKDGTFERMRNLSQEESRENWRELLSFADENPEYVPFVNALTKKWGVDKKGSEGYSLESAAYALVRHTFYDGLTPLFEDIGRLHLIESLELNLSQETEYMSLDLQNLNNMPALKRLTIYSSNVPISGKVPALTYLYINECSLDTTFSLEDATLESLLVSEVPLSFEEGERLFEQISQLSLRELDFRLANTDETIPLHYVPSSVEGLTISDSFGKNLKELRRLNLKEVFFSSFNEQALFYAVEILKENSFDLGYLDVGYSVVSDATAKMVRDNFSSLREIRLNKNNLSSEAIFYFLGVEGLERIRYGPNNYNSDWDSVLLDVAKERGIEVF